MLFKNKKNINEQANTKLVNYKRGLFLDIDNLGNFGCGQNSPIKFYKEDAIKFIENDDFKSAIRCINEIMDIAEYRNKDNGSNLDFSACYGIIKKIEDIESVC